ncbi:unnamed protein product [Haemonchus placei]|uniref:Uncharacterized protein n=1 Tax=Haemonchus placei TaxID=6290 RepID=A0A0N4WZV6_HAEPC|nr:unnamed protein product [Haemonchus placei]
MGNLIPYRFCRTRQIWIGQLEPIRTTICPPQASSPPTQPAFTPPDQAAIPAPAQQQQAGAQPLEEAVVRAIRGLVPVSALGSAEPGPSTIPTFRKKSLRQTI